MAAAVRVQKGMTCVPKGALKHARVGSIVDCESGKPWHQDRRQGRSCKATLEKPGPDQAEMPRHSGDQSSAPAEIHCGGGTIASRLPGPRTREENSPALATQHLLRPRRIRWGVRVACAGGDGLDARVRVGPNDHVDIGAQRKLRGRIVQTCRWSAVRKAIVDAAQYPRQSVPLPLEVKARED